MADVRSEPTIRRALIADAGDISAVLAGAFANYRPSYTDGGFDATTPGPDQIRMRIAEGPVWVAELNGQIVGTVAAVAQPDALYVRGMAVLPAARGMKLGKRLLDLVEAYAEAEGFVLVRLSTTPFLERAIALYQGYGFTFTAGGAAELFGTPLLTMEKQLDRAK